MLRLVMTQTRMMIDDAECSLEWARKPLNALCRTFEARSAFFKVVYVSNGDNPSVSITDKLQ